MIKNLAIELKRFTFKYIHSTIDFRYGLHHFTISIQILSASFIIRLLGVAEGEAVRNFNAVSYSFNSGFK